MLFLSSLASLTFGVDQVVLIAFLVLVAIYLIITAQRNKNKPIQEEAPQTVTIPVAAASAPVAPAVPVAAPVAPGAAGDLKLYDTTPKAAAMVMAIVAYQTGKPLNELRFRSIREIKP